MCVPHNFSNTHNKKLIIVDNLAIFYFILIIMAKKRKIITATNKMKLFLIIDGEPFSSVSSFSFTSCPWPYSNL